MAHKRKFDVTIRYPLPISDVIEAYFAEANFPGWWASGADDHIRTIRLDANRSEVVTMLMDLRPSITLAICLRDLSS